MPGHDIGIQTPSRPTAEPDSKSCVNACRKPEGGRRAVRPFTRRRFVSRSVLTTGAELVRAAAEALIVYICDEGRFLQFCPKSVPGACARGTQFDLAAAHT